MRQAAVWGSMLCFFTGFLLASQVHLQPYEEIAERVSNVCVIKVDRLESEDKYRHFKNGAKKLISTTVIVHGTISRHIHGTFTPKQMTSKFTTIVPIKYSDDGKEEMSFSLMKSISGYEHKAEIGKEYIFTYTWFQKGKAEQYHARMDLLENESKIVEALKQRKPDKAIDSDKK